MRTARTGCTVHRFQCICCFLIMRFDRISVDRAFDEGGRNWQSCRRRPSFTKGALVGMKIFNQIIDVPSSGDCASDVANLPAGEPIRQLSQAPEISTRAAVPELPLGTIEITNCVGTKAGAGRACTDASRRLQGMLEAHRDVPPVEDESCLGRDLSLHLPQSRVAIPVHPRWRAKTDSCAHNRVGEFAR
jgi:hypothetical protein